MNCVNHPETAASAFCRECGKPMCEECRQEALGSIYCAEHSPVMASPPPPPARPAAPSGYDAAPLYTPPTYVPPESPYTTRRQVADPSVHPGLALLLGFAPGVGAIYNGQYAKGLIHAVIFGLMVSFESSSHRGSLEALVGIMIAAWVIYQAFEAYHTARKRRYGVQVEEFSSLFHVKAGHGKFPGGAIVLIGLGFILLLNTMDIISIDVLFRFWPALLIFFGVYLLYARINPAPHETVSGAAPSDGSVRR